MAAACRVAHRRPSFLGGDQVADHQSHTCVTVKNITVSVDDETYRRARIKAADARTEASLAFYERTVLGALEETEDALVDYGHEQTRQQFLEASAQASKQAADLAHQRYESGAADFLSVLDAERTLLEAQDRLAASQTRTATAFVAVYKALGGGVPVTGVKQ